MSIKNNQFRKDDYRFKYRSNEYIRSSELRVVTDTGETLGVMSLEDALSEAQERELDLIEIVPTSNPPVAKIIAWDKFRYELTKKKKQPGKRSNDLKEIWFKAFIEDGDIKHKMKKVREFVANKHNVRLTIKRKGRVSPEALQILMGKLLEQSAEFADVIVPAKFSGPNYSVMIGPKK